MVLPGILRRVNKTLPALLQIIAIICFIHYVAKGVLLKVQTRAHNEHHARAKAGVLHAHSGRAGRTSNSFLRPSSSTKPTSTTTRAPTTPPPTLPDEVVEREQERRLNTLHKACTRLNMGPWASGHKVNFTEEEQTALATVPNVPLYQALLVSEEKRLAVCPVVRAGSQWLARRMLQLTGKFTNTQLFRLHEPPSAIARHHFSFLSSWEKYPEVLPKCVTVLMARHPLDRLLASYLHLLHDPDKNPHGYIHYGKRIVRAYRKAPTPSKGPTFEEFVRFLLEHESRHLDESWHPIIRRCTPCNIPYNAVVHYETLWHDVQWVWRKAGLGPLNTTDYFTESITPKVRREHFSEITLAQIIALYRRFKLDFEIFGYTLEEHIAYAKPGDEEIDPVLMNILPRHNADALQALVREAQEKAVMKQEVSEGSEAILDTLLTGERHPAEVVADNHLPGEETYKQPSQTLENI